MRYRHNLTTIYCKSGWNRHAGIFWGETVQNLGGLSASQPDRPNGWKGGWPRVRLITGFVLPQFWTVST